jgi:hypothetical protein
MLRYAHTDSWALGLGTALTGTSESAWPHFIYICTWVASMLVSLSIPVVVVGVSTGYTSTDWYTEDTPASNAADSSGGTVD